MTGLGTKSDPFQQPISPQLPVDRGAGGRGEALRSAAARSYLRANAGVWDHVVQGHILHLFSWLKLPFREVPFKGEDTLSGTVSHLSDLLRLGHIPPFCWMCVFPRYSITHSREAQVEKTHHTASCRAPAATGLPGDARAPKIPLDPQWAPQWATNDARGAKKPAPGHQMCLKWHQRVTLGPLWAPLWRKISEQVRCCGNSSSCYGYST